MSGDINDDLQAELIKDFLLESSEGLETFDQDLLEIEKGDSDPQLLNQVFRVVHTIKGTAGCLGFNRIESIAHTGENVLSMMRDGELESTPDIADALLKLSDALRAILDVIESCGSDESAGEYNDLRSLLDSVKKGEPLGSADVDELALDPMVNHHQEVDGSWGLFEDDEPTVEALAAEISEPVVAEEAAAGWGLFDVAEASGEASVAKENLDTKPKEKTPEISRKLEKVSGATVRVDVDLLDTLMNMVGELVLSRNQLLQVSQQRVITPAEISSLSQRFNQVTTELQQGVMKTRMQAIGSVWGKYPRIVRDLASDLGKQVSLETFGADTELDRTIIEAIKDPLTHIIRNAVDHGIESPEERAAADKPAVAQLLMRAFHEGGQVNIEIVDDGAGINGERVCRKAIDKGLISDEEATRLTEREMINLIFLPGFSTAEKLSNVSGRGVGMDVVKTNIEKIGGSVDIQSSIGRGTSLRIKIPLTLAIVPALVVKSAAQRFAIPQVSLVELVRLEGDQAVEAVEQVYDSPVFRLRGELLPLVFLDRALKISKPKAEAPTTISIVVLRADRQIFGLVVDEVSDTEEIVVKPLGHQLKGLPLYAGATIMGDGSVAIILDAVGVAKHAGVLNTSQNELGASQAAGEEEIESGKKDSFIIFSLPGWNRLAVPLEAAERLEEFDLSAIERSGSGESVLYRGGIMRLVRLADHIGSGAVDIEPQVVQVIVYECGGRYVGLVVGGIRDIIEESASIQGSGTRPGLLGSAVMQGEITDIIDVPSVLKSAGLNPPQSVA
ncbi:CheW-like domain protein [Verrucomicrobiia bacterium DG1235]|nr:CheW-like domain protein [Verrucomicrobiae bacterium DG1235]